MSLQRTVLLRFLLSGSLALCANATSATEVAQVRVTISPPSLTTVTNATEVLTATVSGTTATAVTWEVNGVEGGTSTAGVISTTIPGTTGEALYLAPTNIPAGGSVTVTAVSQADRSKSASALLTIEAPSRSRVTRYVSTAGSDFNPGTLSAPFRTIQHAAHTAVAGDTVRVRGGVYHEKVYLPNSGDTISGYITFTSYPGETAIVDGIGVRCCGSNGQDGLFTLTTNSYIIIQGFEIRNYTSSNSSVPVGIDFEGAGNYLQILNNRIHNIATRGSSCNSANALGIALYGNEAPASINHVTIMGNEVDHNTTGCSETVTVNGNVQYWVEAHNFIHDDNNIGMDFIGFESMSPNASYDQARDGWNFANTIYSISSSNNPVYERNCWCADGFYADGGTRIIVERDLVHDVDINEAASEQPGHKSSYVTIRNNVIYNMNAPGLSIGGASGSATGGSDHIVLVNNTLYNDSTKVSGQGEFQIQYFATNNTFENNVVYATQSILVNDYTNSTTNPATLDHNDWFYAPGSGAATFVWQNASITGYYNYQRKSKQDALSPFADPRFVDRFAVPPNLDITVSSSAINLGKNLGPEVVGVLDFKGNLRVNANGEINAGAYQR
jgi:hypothetical protein